MGVSYNPALQSDVDWVRMLCGDRDVANARLDDHEIAAFVVERKNKYLAAALACEVILARSGGLVEKQVGDLRLKWGGSAQDQYTKYIQRLYELGAQANLKSPAALRML